MNFKYLRIVLILLPLVFLFNLYWVGKQHVMEPFKLSREMRNFDLNSCNERRCFHAKKDSILVSANGFSFAGRDVDLSLTDLKGNNTVKQMCNVFFYDARVQFLNCDNTKSKNVASLTIDSTLKPNFY